MIETLRDYHEILRRNDCGNKAYNLAYLAEAGLTVPQGRGLSWHLLQSIFAGKEFQDAEQAKEIIANTDLSPLVMAIQVVIPSVKLIVRSSSQYEDSNDHPSYGLYASEICTPDKLEETIKVCLSSPYTSSVLTYKQRYGLSLCEHIPLLVQSYMAGTPSGILLTSNVSVHTPKEMVLEVTGGPCSLITSGRAIPTCYIFHKEDGNIQWIHGDCIFPEALQWEAFTLGQRISSLLGAEVEIEFTISKDEIVILQARKIPPSLIC